MEIADRIKELRKKKGISQKDLAKKLGTSPQNLAQYESGKRQPKIETLDKIASALSVTRYELQGITSEELKKSLKQSTTFYDYLLALGYDVHESPYDGNPWGIYIKEIEQYIFITDDELKALETTTKGNIDGTIYKYLKDGKHNQ